MIRRWRAAAVHLVEHRQGLALRQRAGLQQPRDRQAGEAAASEIDPAKRQALYSQLQTTLVKEVANGFLVDMEFPTLYRANVKNLVRTAIGLNESFDDVYIEK